MTRPTAMPALGKSACLLLAGLATAGTAAPRPVPKVPARALPARVARPELVVQNSHGAHRFAFSPDGRRVAQAGWTVDVRDTASGDLVRRFRAGDDASAAFADGGKTLVFSYSVREEGDVHYVLARADLRSGVKRGIALSGPPSVGVGIPAAPLLLSADGSVALGLRGLSGPDFPAVPVLWDARNGALVREFPRVTGDSVKLALSSDGSTVVIGTQRWANNRPESTLMVFAARSGRCRSTIELPGWWGSSVVLSPDGSRLGALTADQNRCDVRAWDVRTGKELLRREIDLSGQLRAVAFSPDGSLLAGGGDEHSYGNAVLYVYDLHTGASVHVWKAVQGAFAALAFAPDGTLYSSGLEGPGHTWDVRTGKEIRSFPGTWLAQDGTTFSPNGQLCLFGVYGQRYLLDLEHALLPEPDPTFDLIANPAFSPDGRILAWARDRRLLNLMDTGTRTVHQFSPKDSPPEPNWRFGYVHGLAFIPGTHRVVTVGGDSTKHMPDYAEMRIWDLETGAQQMIQQMNRVFQDVVPSADGKLLYVSEQGGSEVHIYKTTGKPVRVLSVPGFQLTQVAAPADGVVATGGEEKQTGQIKVFLWNPVTGEPSGSFDPQVRTLQRLATAGDGTLTVSGQGARGHNRIEIWDTARCRLRHASVTPEGASVLALTADGSLAALALSDGPLGFWDTVADRLLVSLDFGYYQSGEDIGQAWIMWTPEGYYAGSKDADRAYRWRKGEMLFPARNWSPKYHRPDLVLKALRGRRHPAR